MVMLCGRVARMLPLQFHLQQPHSHGRAAVANGRCTWRCGGTQQWMSQMRQMSSRPLSPVPECRVPTARVCKRPGQTNGAVTQPRPTHVFGWTAHLWTNQHQAERLAVVDLSASTPGRSGVVKICILSSAAGIHERYCMAAMQTTGLACQHLPVLTVTYTSRPLRWMAKGTSSVMYPSALKGWNNGGCSTMPSRYPRHAALAAGSTSWGPGPSTPLTWYLREQRDVSVTNMHVTQHDMCCIAAGSRRPPPVC